MIEIGYWKIRGLGAPLRMMCEYGNVEYKDVQYTGEWFGDNKKRILALDPLANLPYVIDGDLCLSQSTAVYVHVATKAGVYGGIKDLEYLCEVYDLRMSVMDLVYPFKRVNRSQEEFEKSVESHCQKFAPEFYAKFEAILEKNKTLFLLKDTPCAADFHLFEMLDQHALLAAKYEHKDALHDFPKLRALHDALKADPKLAKFFASESYKLPCNSIEADAYFY